MSVLSTAAGYLFSCRRCGESEGNFQSWGEANQFMYSHVCREPDRIAGCGFGAEYTLP